MGFRSLAHVGCCCAVALLCAGALARAEPVHGLSAFDELKYPESFAHFDYVNPDAPKGGRLAMIGAQGTYNVNQATFNTFNGYVLAGDGPFGIELLFDSLMVRAADEPDAVYGLVARAADVAEDGMSVTFHLRETAEFADGTPLTAHDVAYSYELLKSHGHPSLQSQIRDVAAVAVLDMHTVRYDFTGEATRDLPMRVALLPIFSRAFYETHDFAGATLTPPLGSGPYRIDDFEPGRFIQYRRRDDYWARDLPVNRGRYNFDELRYEYFRDRTAEFEALKAGEYDLREEYTASVWETGYDIEAVLDGRMIRDVLPDDRPSGAQGFFINTRRAKFADWRVRRALDHAFDFAWANATLFHGLYQRTTSFFENSELKAEGPPSDAELALLEPFRGKLPEEVFGEPYTPPVSDGSGRDRALRAEAARLLDEAGWHVVGGRRVNEEGEALTIEFLTFSSALERVFSAYVQNLKRLGIEATVRRVDPAQYQERLTAFDFDVTTRRFVLSPTPGIELRSLWSSEAAATPGSPNLSGIAHPAVDALIEEVVGAESREALVTAARALDRVLRACNYWVPHWFRPSHTIAYWNKFSRPEFKPKYARGIIDTWWFDAEKAGNLDYSQ